MREYLAVDNLKRASALGAVVALMAVPRIMEGGDHLWTLILTVFPAMIVVAGAATAWGDSAGMCGPFPGRARMRKAMLVAAALGLIIAPIHLWGDMTLREALEAAGNSNAAGLAFPPTVFGCLALALWGTGFETLFFKAATMSFIARVTRRQTIALAGAVLLVLLVSYVKMSDLDLGPMLGVRLFGQAIVSTIGCLLFARGGLPPVMLFVAILDARHLVRLI